MIDQKYPMLKRYKIEVYYTIVGPMCSPSEVEALLERIHERLKAQKKKLTKGH